MSGKIQSLLLELNQKRIGCFKIYRDVVLAQKTSTKKGYLIVVERTTLEIKGRFCNATSNVSRQIKSTRSIPFHHVDSRVTLWSGKFFPVAPTFRVRKKKPSYLTNGKRKIYPPGSSAPRQRLATPRVNLNIFFMSISYYVLCYRRSAQSLKQTPLKDRSAIFWFDGLIKRTRINYNNNSFYFQNMPSVRLCIMEPTSN